MSSPNQSPYVVKARGRVTRTALIWLLFTALFLGAGIWFLQGTYRQASATYDEVTVTATGEHTEKMRQGSRRSARLVDARFVDVQLPDGSTGKVRSDDIQVGSEATVYQAESGKLTESEPDGPGILEWLIGGVLALIGVLVGLGAVGKLRQRMSFGQLADDAPRLLLDVTTAGPADGKDTLMIFETVVREPGIAHAKAGEHLRVVSHSDATPPSVAGPLEARVAKSNEVWLQLYVRSASGGEWFSGDATNIDAQARLVAAQPEVPAGQE